jgi:hypothetical protein
VRVDASDSRSQAQKNQTDLATQRDARLAQSLQSDRLAQEQAVRLGNPSMLSPFDPAATPMPINDSKPGAQQPSHKSLETFKAQIPGTAKKSKKKKTKKKAATPA